MLSKPVLKEKWTAEELLSIEDEHQIKTMLTSDPDKQCTPENIKAVRNFQEL